MAWEQGGKKSSLYLSQLAHPPGSYPSFHSITRGIVLPVLLSPGWDARLSQGYPPAFHQSSLTICWNPFLLLVVQNHSTMTQLGLEPETFNPDGIFENQASPGFRFPVDDWYPLVSDRIH